MLAADLRAITRGLHEAATSANQMIAQQYIRLFDQFFDCNTDALGTPMKARMVEVALDNGHHMQVPLISLVTPRGLALDTMQVDLSVKIAATELDQARCAMETGELNSERFFVTFASQAEANQKHRPDEMRISLTFKACDPPEGVQRIVEEYTRTIGPLPTETD